MANELTGDFDVVAEFTIDAARRVLAAMHRGQRFPHSISIRVSDSSRIPPSQRSITTVVDALGDALDDPLALAQPPGSARTVNVLPTDPALAGVDVVVNAGARRDALLEPSNLAGIAQVQLSPPSLRLADESGTRIALHTQVTVRYFPDPDTRNLPEFFKGEIRITVSLDRVVSQVGSAIEVDLRSSDLEISFNRTFSDEPMVSGDEKAIEQAIHNWIRTRFQPSNTLLPADVQEMQVKAIVAELSALCALLNRGADTGDPASVSNVFLGDGDDFAFAVSREFVLGQFRSAVDQVFPVRKLPAGTYTVFIDTLDLDIPSPFNRFLLTVKGRAITESLLPNFTFDASQAFTLQVVDGEAQLAFLGGLSLTVTSSKNLLSGVVTPIVAALIQGQMEQRKNQFLNRVQPTVGRMLSAQENLGGVLRSLMNPPPRPGATAQEEVGARLAYQSAEIRRTGIVLHGSLDVDDAPPVQVAFERIPAFRRSRRSAQGRFGRLARVEAILTGAEPSTDDYSALGTWIPGGTVEEYRWSFRGQAQPVRVDANRFVLLNPPPAPASTQVTGLFGVVPVCLTVTGTRVSTSGAVVDEPVSATSCQWMSHTMGELVAFTGRGLRMPDVLLAGAAADGTLEVAGHASPWQAGSGGNLLLHFPDERSAGGLESLTRAVRESERPDCATAVVAVLTPDQLRRARYTEGVVYAEANEGQWERAFEVSRRPATLLIAPSGEIAWRHESRLADGNLVAALKQYLVPGGLERPRLLRSSVRVGQPPPNLIFEYSPGHQLTLRKLVGRPVVLMFWKSSSGPSREAVREAQTTSAKGEKAPVVLAINDGEAPEVARRAMDESGLSAILVSDPDRAIGLAYGVRLWPTVLVVGEDGLVREIRYGRTSAEAAGYDWQTAKE